MGKYEKTREMTDRENAEVEKAFHQATTSSSKPKNNKNTGKAKKLTAKQRKIIIISACAAVLVLLIALIVGIIVSSSKEEDDGLILSNVCAGGVNLGGMTVDEAKNALHLATDNTFSKKDMVILLPDGTITLTPADTGAALNVDAVVEAAYNYGRTGTEAEQEQARESAATTIHTIALLPYLNLDLPYIQSTIEEFCDSYSSEMTQPSVVIEGDRPAYDPEYPDLTVIHQTMTLVMGTPDYALDADDIYDRVLDAYSLNELKVTYEAPTATEPDHPSAEALFTEHCVAPVDAVIDEATFEVTPEVYGYGFDIEAVQELIDKAGYGETITIQLDFLIPDITAEGLTENLFLDTLGSCTASSSGNSSANRNTNLNLSCQAINDYVIKAGEEFSFNDVVGRPTADKGYKKATMFVDGESMDVLGGGINQTASALYYCALMADLDIQERHSHDYAVSFIDLGFDACVNWGAEDLRFRNNTDSPIRIIAHSDGNTVNIQLLGIDELDYTVELSYEITKQNNPLTAYQTMDKNNVLGYKDGDVLQDGITGYEVDTYASKYDEVTGELIVKTLLDSSSYAKRDKTVVRIESEVIVKPDPTDPTDPTEETDPTDTSEVTDPTDATDPTDPGTETDPVENILNFFEGIF